jgi:ATP-dependent Lon protease
MLNDLVVQADIEDISDMMPLIDIEHIEKTLENEQFPKELPLVALKNTVLFPGVIMPISIGRNKSIKAVQKAQKSNKLVAVIAQRDPDNENPTEADLHPIGVIAKIVKLIRLPDDTTTVILQGKRIFKLSNLVASDPFLRARVEVVEEPADEPNNQLKAISKSIRDISLRMLELSPQIPQEASVMLKNVEKERFLIHFIASNMNAPVTIKQEILESPQLLERAELLLKYLSNELQILELKDEIDSKVRAEIDKQQRDYYLNQQIRSIQEELGQEAPERDLDDIAARAINRNLPQHARATFDRELRRARRMMPQAPEYAITLNYLELLVELPWNEQSQDQFDLKKAKEILDQDHFGLHKVKNRILEHLAVLALKGNMRVPILCLVGSPGVGKTSLGRSIAHALQREYVRISLGGLHDESEIRGHRRTYIGAMPGRIIQSLKKAGKSNPVFILDEIDKIGKDFRGDPSSALLEVLDPEQNSTFYDNFLELEFDLSKVLFIATANSLATIQPALLDRMEIIHIEGYSLEEKIEIANKHLVADQLKEHGLTPKALKLKPEVLAHLIQQYTRESGVRELNRQIAALCRGTARKVAMSEKYSPTLKIADLHALLGPALYSNALYHEKQPPGVAIGLAWTAVGGDILFIETLIGKGKEGLQLTGNLGEVMKESAATALSWLKVHASQYGIDPDTFEKTNIHIHVPEGAIPKDGPSAGVTLLSALASAFANKPIRSHLAMTGEITLRGKVLPVGGIKEKVLAARRAGIQHILLCKDNEKDVQEINPQYIQDIHFHYIQTMHEVLRFALS